MDRSELDSAIADLLAEPPTRWGYREVKQGWRLGWAQIYSLLDQDLLERNGGTDAASSRRVIQGALRRLKRIDT